MGEVLREASRASAGYVRCETVREVIQTYLCVFAERSTQNASLGRAGLFIEMNLGVVADKPFLAHPLLQEIAAHDYQAARLREYVRARRAALESAKKSAKKPDSGTDARAGSQTEEALSESGRLMLAREESFWRQWLLPLLERDKRNFVLITAAANASPAYALRHEVCHAQYFNSERYRRVVRNFWLTRVSREERERLKSLFSPYYNTKDEFLVLNEFQAYVLDGGMRFSDYSMNYGNDLRAALEKAGERLVRVRFSD